MQTTICLVDTFDTSKHSIELLGRQVGTRPGRSYFLHGIHQYIDDDDIGARPARIMPVSWSTNIFSVSTRSVRGFALLLLPSAEGLLGVVGVGGALKPGGD